MTNQAPGERSLAEITAELEADALAKAVTLAQAVRALRLHLEHKKQALYNEDVATINSLAMEEHLLTQKVSRAQAAFDAALRVLGQRPAKGNFGEWLSKKIVAQPQEIQTQILALPEDLIACQQLQVSLQEMLRRSLKYYQSMTNFMTGVRDYIYTPPKEN